MTEKKKPETVHDYNRTKVGVDIQDAEAVFYQSCNQKMASCGLLQRAVHGCTECLGPSPELHGLQDDPPAVHPGALHRVTQRAHQSLPLCS